MMRALPYLYQCWCLFIYCWGVPNPQKQRSNSFASQTATLSTFNNIPWLLTIDETCQGVILNQWWILSTISCLTKLKYVNSDISKVITKEGILHGDKICLHSRFNPCIRKYSIKGVRAMILLEVPIKIEDILLPQYYNILRKSCFPCVYQRCSVYQYQKHTKFENNVKKLSVKFLDISFCCRQHNHMPRSNKLCIWNHQKEDCWIQQGSPVLCTFGSHWELVGLISESSMAREISILVIKTAPYLPWRRWLVNMNEKLLDPIFSSLFISYPGVEHDLSNDIIHVNIFSDGLSLQLLSRLITSSQNRPRRNPPTVFFISNDRDSFPEMLFSEEPTPVLSPQSDPQDNLSLEPLPTRQTKLNISLSECHLSMIWNDNLQTLWLYKTAVVSHDTTECGIRPGLVPYCPDCWEAEIGEFPWLVSMQMSFAHFCAGSILNEMWVLTSARCANFIKRSESMALVHVGLVDLQDPTQGETVGIQRSLPYLSPRGPLGPGLIFLKEPIHFKPLVFPICLEESQEQERHIQLYDCWLPNWSVMRGSPGILQKRHLSIMQVSSCAKFWPQLNEFTFCVKAKKSMGESGCKGDLGAPLVCHLKQKDIWMQVGILIDFDEHCKKPYVFSQVSPFKFWLQRVTQLSRAPWSPDRPVIISPFNSLSVSTSRKVSTFTSSSAAVHPHFISLPQPQALTDHISVQYAMPWQAIIFSCGNQICSGSIISSYWVLTAAHCVRNMNPENTLVILGLRHPRKPLRVAKVTTILLHERFQLVNQAARNDLALVLLREGQSSIHIMAPLGSIKDLNTSECWLSGPQILKEGSIFENLDMLQIQVMGAPKCAYLYPDIGSSTVCYNAQAGVPVISIESMSPGSAVICRPLYGNRKWRQIGFTSLKHLATIVAPHFSWILSSTAKSGYPLDQALIPWVENSKSSRLEKHPTTLLLSIIMIISVKRVFIL